MIKRCYLFIVLMAAGYLAGHAAPALAATYQVDKDHTAVLFKIRNFMSNAQGSFHDFQGTVDYDPDKTDAWMAMGTIEVKSIDTKNFERDHHLLSKDFFEAEKFPVISFRMEKVASAEKTGAEVQGSLKIHGVERSVPIHVQNLGLSRDKNGAQHLTFTATARVDRKDFGMNYSSGGPGKIMLGDNVTITLQVDAIRKD